MENIENKRCDWCGEDPLYVQYHDNEWGRLTTGDRELFEMLCLEGAQAGLSWITILRRRHGYRRAFHNFDIQKCAAMTDEDVERLMNDSSIIRNRAKIRSVISNAKAFVAVQQEFGSFYRYITGFLPEGKPIQNNVRSVQEIPASTPLSDAISKDMRRRGFKFFGTTICYAFLQSCGFVNDHLTTCPFRPQPD